MAKVKVKGRTGVKVKRNPVKAGSKHTDTSGGIFTTKVVKIVKKQKDE